MSQQLEFPEQLLRLHAVMRNQAGTLQRVAKIASSTFLVGKRVEIGFSGGANDTGKDVSIDIGAG